MSCNGKPDEWIFDERIKDALHSRADAVEPSAAAGDELFRRIGGLRGGGGRENFSLRRFAGQILLVCCAIFCLSGVNTFASSGGAGDGGWVTVSDSWHGPFYDAMTLEEAAQQARLLDYEPKWRASIGDFEFERAHISRTQRLDADHERMSYVYKEFCVMYLNSQSGERLNQFVADFQLSLEPGLERRFVGDVAVIYSEMPYKFVPLDYELTEEDKRAMDEGRLMISCGALEIEDQLMKSISWVQDSLRYTFFIWDSALTADDFFALAEELINYQQPENLK